MANKFAERIKRIEDELIALKTASEYSSMRTSYVASPVRVTTGLYRVDFNAGGQPILSKFYRQDATVLCYVSARTPSGNSQIVEVNTTKWDNQRQEYVTYENGLSVVANVPIISITRI
jgi:hypothetical protein